MIFVVVVLFVVGFLVVFVSFLAALANMGQAAENDRGQDTRSLFGRHLGAMAGMVVGLFLVGVGILTGAVQVLARFGWF